MSIGVSAGNQDGRALAARPRRTAGPLPQTHHGRRQADAQRHVDFADVDAQFQGTGGKHQPDRTIAQPLLDRLPLLGGQAGPVDADVAVVASVSLLGRRAIIRSAAMRLGQKAKTVNPASARAKASLRPVS